jgi:hypothetical protein
MATARMRTVISAAVGVAAGYLVWLGGTAIIVATTPVDYWVISVAILLIVLTSGAVVLAIRSKHTRTATAFWLAPILPILVSVYLLVVVVT